MKLKIESSDCRVTNAQDEGRAYDIAATVHVENGTATSVGGGSVTDREGQFTAWFDAQGESALNVNWHTSQGRAAVLAAIEEFVLAAKETAAAQ